jgi:hypothetical protein
LLLFQLPATSVPAKFIFLRSSLFEIFTKQTVFNLAILFLLPGEALQERQRDSWGSGMVWG